MSLGLLGYKVGMTQVFAEDGKVEPVTVLELGPCPVLQIRYPSTKEGNRDVTKDGYSAVQLGFKDKPRKAATRPEQATIKVERIRTTGEGPAKKYEAYTEEMTLKVGQVLKVGDVFKDVLAVDVIGTSKGRGFQGVMKRHGFAGLPAAHGAKKVHRQAGSTSSLASNRGSGRPKKGLRRAGQYGNERVTIRNLTVVKVDAENNLLLVRGGIPGFPGAVVMVRPTNKVGPGSPKAKTRRQEVAGPKKK